MNVAKLFKVAQKGSKKVKRHKAAGAATVSWPEGTRIGLFGHENSGKTVLLWAVYTKSQTTRNFSMAVRDGATSDEFLKTDMAIKGLKIDTTKEGTQVPIRVPRKFPEPTETGALRQFTAILDGSKKIPVVTYDYNGRAASVSEHSDEAEKISEFMTDADGLLFLFDPRILGSDPEVQARVQSFVNILELIAPLKARLPIPVGLVITKADTLRGYGGEDKTVLIRPKDEQTIADDYDKFLERVLGFESLSDGREWASSVRNILVKLQEFIRVVVGRTLDFQVFFVSSTGTEPKKIGVARWHSIFEPPEKINPCGVTAPFHWVLTAIERSRRLNTMRTVTRVIAAVATAWIVIWSLPYMIYLWGDLDSARRAEEKALKEAGEAYEKIGKTRRDLIGGDYASVAKGFLWMFRDFGPPASDLSDLYYNYPGGDVGRLDGIIGQLTEVVRDENQRPKHVVSGGKDKLEKSEDVQRLLKNLDEMSRGKQEAIVRRAERISFQWGLFMKYLENQSDVSSRNALLDRLKGDESLQDFDPAEAKFGEALKLVIGHQLPSPGGGIGDYAKALSDYESLQDRVNATKPDPAVVLGEAVTKAQKIEGELDPALHADKVRALRRFIAAAQEFQNTRSYTLKLNDIFPQDHLHIEVTNEDGEPTWSKPGQWVLGGEEQIEWKPGNHIYVAYDKKNHCQRGKYASASKAFVDEYALFDVVKRTWTFEDIGKSVTISFKPDLSLPKLEE